MGRKTLLNSVNAILNGMCFNSELTILMANKNAQKKSERFLTYIY